MADKISRLEQARKDYDGKSLEEVCQAVRGRYIIVPISTDGSPLVTIPGVPQLCPQTMKVILRDGKVFVQDICGTPLDVALREKWGNELVESLKRLEQAQPARFDLDQIREAGGKLAEQMSDEQIDSCMSWAADNGYAERHGSAYSLTWRPSRILD